MGCTDRCLWRWRWRGPDMGSAARTRLGAVSARGGGCQSPLSPSEPPGPAGAAMAQRDPGLDDVAARPVGGWWRGGVAVLGLDPFGPLQLQGPQSLLDARHLGVAGGGQGVGVADKPDY